MTIDGKQQFATMDGNTAAAYTAYRVNETCAIFPITPSSPMAELADEWASAGIANIWGNVPVIQEMQSEAGAAGAVHGSLQAGALTTTFTASQGLLLMIPNMFKIAGELTASVFHVAARSIATHALSIFGDHSDVMAIRSTGFALLASGSVQEAHDMALIAQAATLQSRVPFLHFFDGFRTSHEINTITLLKDTDIRAMIDDKLVHEHRARALNPEQPFIRGTAQNPDVFFQGREATNPFYDRVPAIVEETMSKFARLVGRSYHLFEYDGAENAERVIVIMTSGAEVAREVVANLCKAGEKVGVVTVHLYRPFSASHFLSILPPKCRAIAVLDRTKEPGAVGEPLYMDVVAVLTEAFLHAKLRAMPTIIGGRYGLSSKDFDPPQVRAAFEELKKENPKNGFTVGIVDDVTHRSLTADPSYVTESKETVRALFYGLGADGTVGANKNSVKIIAEDGELFAQGYFVYDSHKSGAETVSHLRFGAQPINSPYLIRSANFIACHQFYFLHRLDILRFAVRGATFLLNSPYGPEGTWDQLPRTVQEKILEKDIKLFVIDATRVAKDLGLNGRINTILQTCFFAISDVLPRAQAIKKIKNRIRKTYSGKGRKIVEQNFAAVDSALAHLHAVQIPKSVTSKIELQPVVPHTAPDFVRKVTAKLIEGRGDELKVSELPVDGTFPSGSSIWEKRNIAEEVPVWRPDLCVQCGQCSFVCPHSVIRAKYFEKSSLADAPKQFKSAPINVRGYPDIEFSLQFYVEDCTGCGLCVEACPVRSPVEPGVRAVNLEPKISQIESERVNIAFFEKLPINDRARIDFSNVRGVQFLEPLFEFSGACAGCGETPYLKLLSQLFGDRLMVANATGCSSIYGGNLPVTPWSKNKEGRGPAWSNSLFEDNAEFGFGFRFAADKHLALATSLLKSLTSELGDTLVAAILTAPQIRESEIRAQRMRVAELKVKLFELASHNKVARDLISIVDHFVRRSIWIVGGDGWAYDIGYGGLDHVLASGRNVNILVLDTEVYSNTGGQASKATPLGAIAKFAAGGKRVQRKDLALQAIAYGNVYVAQVALGANPQQTLQAFREAEAYDGPSLILAYSPCIAHGYDLRNGLSQQGAAVASGYWPLLRYDPVMGTIGKAPFQLDSPRPTVPFKKYANNELRYRALSISQPEIAKQLFEQAQAGIEEKYRTYERFSRMKGGPDIGETAIVSRKL